MGRGWGLEPLNAGNLIADSFHLIERAHLGPTARSHRPQTLANLLRPDIMWMPR
jgi:hypothetical protein